MNEKDMVCLVMRNLKNIKHSVLVYAVINTSEIGKTRNLTKEAKHAIVNSQKIHRYLLLDYFQRMKILQQKLVDLKTAFQRELVSTLMLFFLISTTCMEKSLKYKPGALFAK